MRIQQKVTLYEKMCTLYVVMYYFLNWDSLHARLNNHYKAWSYKKNKRKKIKTYRKSV